MSSRLLDDLARARPCVERLVALGATVRDVFVSRHGATIALTAPGSLVDHLDARQVPILCAIAVHMAIVDGCLVSWPAKETA